MELPEIGLAQALGLSLALISGLGCSDSRPAATKVEDNPRVTRYGRPQQPPRSDNPLLKDAGLDTPTEVSGAALPDADIAKTYARFLESEGKLQVVQRAAILRECANRDPASARCDGELGLVLLPEKNRRAAALYYLERGAGTDDPGASADLYARMGESLRRHGKYSESAACYARAYARDDLAIYHAGRAGALAGVPGPTAELPNPELDAADELAKAQAIQESWDWMRDEAIIRARIPGQLPRALELMDKTAALAPQESTRARFKTRADELRAQIAVMKAGKSGEAPAAPTE